MNIIAAKVAITGINLARGLVNGEIRRLFEGNSLTEKHLSGSKRNFKLMTDESRHFIELDLVATSRVAGFDGKSL
jgi:hypothetical protein